MNDRPTAAELIAAVRGFLEAELLPALSDARLRFQALVAANVLAVAGRELAGEEALLREECGLLDEAAPQECGALRRAVLQANEALCTRIRAGDYDDPDRFREAVALVRRAVVRKLEVANPRYLEAVSRGASQ
jgi:hypothetical protein